jgi:hypothetical protein
MSPTFLPLCESITSAPASNKDAGIKIHTLDFFRHHEQKYVHGHASQMCRYFWRMSEERGFDLT